jgi:FlaA1/EpsC-like NDP-sugar epimerase
MSDHDRGGERFEGVMNQYVKRARFWRVAATVFDLIVAASAIALAFVTIFGDEVLIKVPGFLEKTLGFTLIFAAVYWLFSIYRGSWRYVSIPDFLAIVKVSVVAVVAYTTIAFLMTRGSNIPRSVPAITLMYLMAGLSVTRLSYRLLMERDFFKRRREDAEAADHKTRNVLLYGVTDNAESFIRTSRRGAASKFNVVGLVDNGLINQARTIQGVRVLGDLDNLKAIVRRFTNSGIHVSELIVTDAKLERHHLAEIVEHAAGLGLKTSRVPDFTETSLLTSSKLLEPKAIDLGDLLGRPEVVADLEEVARLINNKTIMVTGAGGSIGSELCRQIAEFGPRQLVLTDSSEFLLYVLDMEIREKYPQLNVVARFMNVRDANRVNLLFAQFKPDSVFHAAALKHVPLVEDNPVEGIKTNLLGTRNVADAAIKYEAANFVMISTDKAVNPTNVMGASKRAAEAYCQSLDVGLQKTRFKTVRFGNVLGSNGSVVPRFQEQIANGGPITVTHPNIVRFFMTIPEAVRLVLNASAHQSEGTEERGKIMVLDMGSPVKIVDLAERMIQLAGFRPYLDIDIVFTGLRPGEKLYEELFDPDEIQEGHPESSYFIASPRVIDKPVLHRTLAMLQDAVAREDQQRSISLLNHIVPEFTPGSSITVTTPDFEDVGSEREPKVD